MAADEDDRYVNVRPGQLRLKVQAVLARQPDIEDQAARGRWRNAVREFADGGEAFRAQTDRTQQAVNRLADIRVVVDYDDHRLVAGFI